MDVDYSLFQRQIDEITRELGQISEEGSSYKPRVEAWSAREILGHLIDSACNNHRRFVLAQTQDHLEFDGYDENAWVQAQGYNDAPWKSLVALWRGYNLHIARVMAAAPVEERLRGRHRHNLDEISWQKHPSDEPATLAYMMNDYIGHIHHHLAQIRRTIPA